MSEINSSITIQMSPPLHNSTLKTSLEETEIKIDTVETIQETMNNRKIESVTEMNIININNNHNLIKNNCEKSKKIDEVENKLPKLKIVIPNASPNNKLSQISVVNDISKLQSPIQERNSTEFVITNKENGTPSPNKTPNKPMMGRSALLKKSKTDANDSLIIHDIITDKYNGVLNHYFNRMYQRRQSKTDSYEGDSSDTVFSTPPNNSPMTMSSTGTPSSMGPDEKNGFNFPIYAELNRKNDHSFIESTDDDNAETTVDESEHTSVTSTETDNAIGDVSNCPTSPGISNISNDLAVNNKTNLHHPDHSVGTSEISALISRASNLYTSMKRSLSRKSITKISLEGLSDNCDSNILSFTSENAIIENLMKELSKQNEIIFQVSKALNYCKATKEFASSKELLEAERILLIALCTKEALSKEIQNIDDGEIIGNVDNSTSMAEIELSDLKFSLDQYLVNIDLHKEFTEYFLVVLTCESTVFASEIVEADENDCVKINKTFRFGKLPSAFEIRLSVYSMKVEKRNCQNQDLKNCPSPKRIFFSLHKNHKKHKILDNVFHFKPSSFTLCGNCDIRRNDLSRLKLKGQPCRTTLKLKKFPSSCSLSNMFTIDIKSEIVLENKMNGFLTIGLDNEHGCTIWNRRWCVLDGPMLKYWNYPSEELSTPLGSVDLTYCVEQQISNADRSICARPKTIMLPIQIKDLIKKYMLSADNFSELKLWESEINYVLRSLTTWNCMSYNYENI